MYIFRLTPFTRGYTSVIAGLLQVKAKVFFPITFLSALTWASVYVVIGNLIGPFWNLFEQNIHSFKYVMLVVLAVIAGMVVLIYYIRKKVKKGKVFINIY
jgi:membrane protein DedA with SNARE-associated domain